MELVVEPRADSSSYEISARCSSASGALSYPKCGIVIVEIVVDGLQGYSAQHDPMEVSHTDLGSGVSHCGGVETGPELRWRVSMWIPFEWGNV